MKQNIDIDDTIKKVLQESMVDEVVMEVPLFIRILEYAKEDAKDDVDLHELAEKAITLTKKNGCLKMKHYNELV